MKCVQTRTVPLNLLNPALVACLRHKHHCVKSASHINPMFMLWFSHPVLCKYFVYYAAIKDYVPIFHLL